MLKIILIYSILWRVYWNFGVNPCVSELDHHCLRQKLIALWKSPKGLAETMLTCCDEMLHWKISMCICDPWLEIFTLSTSNFFLWNLLYPNYIFNLDINFCISKDYKLFKLSKCFSHVTSDTISTITSQNTTLLFPSFSMLSGMRVYVHDHEPRIFCFISFLFKYFPRFTTAQLRCQAHKGCEQCFTGSFYPMWIACLY